MEPAKGEPVLKCVLLPGCGRCCVAARPIRAGETVFLEEAYTFASNLDSPHKQFCVFCACQITGECVRCNTCLRPYCCARCKCAHEQDHETQGECAVLQLMQLVRSGIQFEDLDTFQMVCMVIARCYSEGKGALLEYTTDHNVATGCLETVAYGSQALHPSQFLSLCTTGDEVTVLQSTYEHVECLGTNQSQTDAEILSDFSRLYDIYVRGTRKHKNRQKLGDYCRFFPQTVTRDIFVSLSCAFLCNGFGIWDSLNRKKATALYPQSSYFNHSCAPNLGRRNRKLSRTIEFFAARNIEANEPLCISYVDVRMPASMRKAKLKATYSFGCQCPRCVPEADEVVANTVEGELVPPICDDCEGKILQPQHDGMYVCPCCDKIQRPVME